MSEQPYKWMSYKNDNILLYVKIVPNSSRNSITIEEEYMKIKLTAPAVDNKANKALIDFLSKKFNTPKTAIEILFGQTSKQKKILLPISAEQSILYAIEND